MFNKYSSQGHENCPYNAKCLFHLKSLFFDIFPRYSETISAILAWIWTLRCGRYQAPSLMTINDQPFSLPRYCGISGRSSVVEGPGVCAETTDVSIVCW